MHCAIKASSDCKLDGVCIAGLRQFDSILSVDGKELKGMSKEQLPPLIVGKVNHDDHRIPYTRIEAQK